MRKHRGTGTTELGARGEVAAEQCGFEPELADAELRRRNRLVGEIREQQQVEAGEIVGQTKDRRIDAHHRHRCVGRRRAAHGCGEQLLRVERQQTVCRGASFEVGDERR